MKITLYDSQNDLTLGSDSIKHLVTEVFLQLEINSDEIIINFISTEKMQQLHEEFFNDSSETDCITFPIDGQSKNSDNYHIIGEVFICPKIAIDTMPANPYLETSLYLIHTILHLVGYEDTQDKLKKIMDLKQFTLLESIKSKNLLLRK